MGGFSLADIPSGTRVIEYLGRKISKEESLRECELNNQCIFYLDDEYDLDGNVEWNPARLLNHSCAPNCDAEKNEADGSIAIVARRDILAGEEVTFNYGYDLESFRDYPCHCGSPGCIGYMLAEELHSPARRATRVSTPSSIGANELGKDEAQNSCGGR